MKSVYFTAWSLLALQLVVFAVFCWPDGPDWRFKIAFGLRIDQDAAASARSEAIRSEIDALGDHDWAGVYRPDFNCWDGPLLEIAPENGVVAWDWRACGNSWIGNHGEILNVSEERIEFVPVIDPEFDVFDWGGSRRPTLDSVLVRVRWCDRRYLVAGSHMLAFCNDVNWMGDGSFVGFVRDVRDADGVQCIPPVSGLPEVPEEWRPYLLDRPVEATLVSIDPPRELAGISRVHPPIRVTARADRGRASGLLPGMNLHWERGDLGGSFEITSVDDNGCSLESIGDDWTNAPDRLPPIGTRLSTGR